MRYLMLVATTKNPGPVPPAMIAAMDQLVGEGMKDGTLRDGVFMIGADKWSDGTPAGR
jgi:hypothetical protein